MIIFFFLFQRMREQKVAVRIVPSRQFTYPIVSPAGQLHVCKHKRGLHSTYCMYGGGPGICDLDLIFNSLQVKSSPLRATTSTNNRPSGGDKSAGRQQKCIIISCYSGLSSTPETCESYETKPT